MLHPEAGEVGQADGIHIEYDDFYSQSGDGMVTPKDWAETAKALLKAELKRRIGGYRELAEKLTANGWRGQSL